MKSVIAAGTALALAVSSPGAHAFCGFYVNGSNKKMFNEATNVVLMRSGTRTVLAMQNDYRGPLEDFAMVIPVPVVLRPTDVRVVPVDVFDRIDSLGSPRLVEYWERDPCYEPPRPKRQRYAGKYDDDDEKPMKKSKKAGDEGDDDKALRDPPERERERKAVPPVLANFSVFPSSITAGLATPIRWTYAFANAPWPTPTCSVDHGVGNVFDGRSSSVTLEESSTLTLTCRNSAGSDSKQARINVVKIEAKFDVAEYQILILSAKEATGLEEWLRLNNYKIPDGAGPLLRPYIEAGSKFFVARVDPKKVQMVDGHVALSPLRFHYDSEEFSLPIRLGMANSPGKQDLIVNIISPDRRYEVANYKNVTIPTNFDVKETVKDRFGEFYASLFDKTVDANPGAVVTEYAWTAPAGYGKKCDPCPPVVPNNEDMMTLGGDVIGGTVQKGGFVLTRLHARYGVKDFKDDLRFRDATPITGGREIWNGTGIEYNATPSSQNYFQARYAIRHWWTGPIRCENPRRGVWGGPTDGGRRQQVIAASKTAFAPRGKLPLASVIERDLTEIGVKRASPAPTRPAPVVTPRGKAMWLGGGALAALLVGFGILLGRRRR